MHQRNDMLERTLLLSSEPRLSSVNCCINPSRVISLHMLPQSRARLTLNVYRVLDGLRNG